MGEIFMSSKEVDRYTIMEEVSKGKLKLVQAAPLINLSYRQTKRLWKRYCESGKKGLISLKRGKLSNNRTAKEIEDRVVALIKERYIDFGPTFTSEKLEEEHFIVLSKEKIRQLKIGVGLHTPKKAKSVRIHQRRIRRSCEGELIQIDGSPHAWLEDRGPKCTLLLAVDDATSKIMAARFETSETTKGYFLLIEDYIERHGIPRTLYADKYSVFRVNHGNDRTQKTQFARAAEELEIELINADSPEAKGRIERKNGVLQDRLIKEMRLLGISTIDQANEFLPEYIEKHNIRFEKAPANPLDAHRPLDQKLDLKNILCCKETRKISKNLEVQHKNRILQIQASGRERSLRGQRVVILEHDNNDISIEFKGKKLEFIDYKELPTQPQLLDYKSLETAIQESFSKTKQRWQPSKNHPWRRSHCGSNTCSPI